MSDPGCPCGPPTFQVNFAATGTQRNICTYKALFAARELRRKLATLGFRPHSIRVADICELAAELDYMEIWPLLQRLVKVSRKERTRQIIG